MVIVILQIISYIYIVLEILEGRKNTKELGIYSVCQIYLTTLYIQMMIILVVTMVLVVILVMAMVVEVKFTTNTQTHLLAYHKSKILNQ